MGQHHPRLYLRVVLVFVVVLSVSVFFSWFTAREMRNLAQSQFEEQTTSLTHGLQRQLSAYTDLLYGVRGLFDASKSVERHEFEAYVSSLNIFKNYPEIDSVDFIKRVTSDHKAAFLAETRTDTTTRPQGFPAFTIFPESTKDEYDVMTYAEPVEKGEKKLGFDASSDPLRKVALESARDSGDPVATDHLTLLSGHLGFLILVPVYSNVLPHETLSQRRANIIGFVAVSFETDQFFRRLDDDVRKQATMVNAEVYDQATIDPHHLLYHSKVILPESTVLELKNTIPVAGETWVIRFQGEHNFGLRTAERMSPYVVLGIGLILSVLLSYVMYDLMAAHARAQEREIEKMKSEFVSIASHQLRTPLTGIKWFAELMLAGKAGPVISEQKDFLEQIHASNERMIRLVENLLNVSRIETGTKFEIKKAPTDITAIIRSLATDLAGLCHDHEVALEQPKKFPKRYVLSIDADKIRQVFQNLLSNAIKYSRKGGKVVVDFKDLKAERKVLITIRDNGLGIPKQQQSRMFEKFFRADNVQTAETDGTGLGLYIAKAIIEGHGGSISFESEENVGTTFFVELPTAI